MSHPFVLSSPSELSLVNVEKNQHIAENVIKLYNITDKHTQQHYIKHQHHLVGTPSSITGFAPHVRHTGPEVDED